MNSETTLARRARARRLELNRTQKQIADRINQRGRVKVTRRDISRVETGELITPHFIEDLAVVLEVSTMWLAADLTVREAERLLEGTAVAAGFGASGTMADFEQREIQWAHQREGALLRALLFMLVWVAICGVIVYWAVNL